MKLHQILITEDKKLPKLVPHITNYCIMNVRDIFRDYDYHLYSGEELEEIIKNNFDKDVLTSYNKLKPFAYKADLARACLLYLHGGLYIDLHIQFIVNPFDGILNDYDFCAFREGHFSNTFGLAINNSIMCCNPRVLIMENLIKQIVLNCKREYYGIHTLHPTGPSCLGKIFHMTINDQNENRHILMGELRALTSTIDAAYISNAEILIALRRKKGSIIELGIEKVNNHYTMYKEKEVYDQNIKF